MGKCLTKLCPKKKRGENQHGPLKLDILKLPEQLREKIWRCLDVRTRKCVRQVCSLFKAEIDLGAGLKVRVDDRAKGNLDFVKSVEVQHAVIVHLTKARTDLFRCNLNVEHLETRCTVTQPLYRRIVLPLSQNLLSLALTASSLMHKAILPEDLAATASVKENPFVFPRLLSLQFQYGQVVNVKSETMRVFNYNMVIIMRSFYCPCLINFIVHPDPNILKIVSAYPDWIPAADIEWENSPLKAFVHLHRNTLQLLDLFLYAREIDEDHYDYYEYPKNLKDFIVVAPFITFAREFIGKYYWKSVISTCYRLYRLILQIEFWHNYSDFFEVAPAILARNAETLTIIRLESFALDEENLREQGEYRRNSVGFVLHFGIFSVCTHLRVLEVCQLNKKKKYVAVDLLNLPLTLERLEIKRIFIPSEELYELRSFPRLEQIRLYHVGSGGIFGVNYKALRKIWMNKTLESLTVFDFNFGESPLKLARIIEISQKHNPGFHLTDKKPTVMVRDVMKHIIK